MTAKAPETPVQATETDPLSEFHIDNEAAANWYLRKLANLEAEKNRVQQQAAVIVKQLDADAEGLRYLYESELQAFVRSELAKNGNRRKSLHFLQGSCQFRTVPASVKIADTTAALHHAQNAFPAAVKTVPTLDTDAYRKAAQDALNSGEVLPGIEPIPERESFTVKFGKSE